MEGDFNKMKRSTVPADEKVEKLVLASNEAKNDLVEAQMTIEKVDALRGALAAAIKRHALSTPGSDDELQTKAEIKRISDELEDAKANAALVESDMLPRLQEEYERRRKEVARKLN